ncbi:MAG: hypothetical protein ABI672_20245 [Vicinamibacteria bacterium]
MPRFTILLGALLSACAPAAEPPRTAAVAAPVAAAPAAAAPVAPNSSSALVIRNYGGAELVSVQPGPDGLVTVAFDANGQKTTLVGKMSDPAKRKYRSGDAVLFETKWDDDGFKLRSPDGALLYKVKLKDDKIKVSDNEENANPFELKTRGGDRIKLVAPGDKEIGNVRGTVVEDGAGKKMFEATGRPGSAGYAVLLLDKIPPAQRYIILAELFMRGK